jgi:hypothetical protein
VRGEKAQLYVNGVEQPTLLVNDLKQKQSKGAVALWIGPGTLAHFSNVRISPKHYCHLKIFSATRKLATNQKSRIAIGIQFDESDVPSFISARSTLLSAVSGRI